METTRARARKALRSWTEQLAKITAEGIEKNDLNVRVDPKNLSRWIVGLREGALLIGRLENNEEPLRDIPQHLDKRNVRARNPLYFTHTNRAGAEGRSPLGKTEARS